MILEDNLKQLMREALREELTALGLTKNGKPMADDDELMTASQAAKLLKVSTGFLYQHSDRLPFAVRLSPDCVRFSRRKLQEEIARRLKMQAKPES